MAAAEIQQDVVAEGQRLLSAAVDAGVPLRLVGGAAVRLRAPEDLPVPFRRSYGDLDFVTARGASKGVAGFFRDQGYDPHVSFNALNGRDRLLFFDDANERQVDVFVGSFRMSHEIPLDGRLDVDAVSIPLAELLLTKLQIHELNEKDVCDTLALVHDHPVADADGDTVNAAQVAGLCAGDWGLWRTITANLDTCLAHVDRYELEPGKREEVEGRLRELRERIEAEPKSRGWRLRAKIGERKRWYETPEEPGGE